MTVPVSAQTEPEDATRIGQASEQPNPNAPLSRWVLAGIAAGFTVITFLQAPGKIEADTKLSLVLDPGSYFRSSLHLWNGQLFGGAVTQAADLLFPMDPFFALMHALHVPTWCAERLWLALLLTAGCWGIVRLAEALGIGRPYARVLGGLSYVAAPIVLTWTTTTAALLAVVLLPWVLRPLVVGSRAGSPRRAAARSGVALALIGGANATVVLALLPVPVLWLLTRHPGPRRRALMGWWVVALACACFWWALSLVLAGRYGYNYLPYTEAANVTTSTASAFEALRGASYWSNYYTLGGALIPGAWTVVSSSVVIVATSVVTGLGLAGLCRRIPERLFLVGTLSIGVVAIAIAYAGPFGGPLAHTLQSQLDTNLSALRSVTKFAPDVALPLALGFAWLLSPAPRTHGRRVRTTSGVTATRLVVGLLAVIALVLAATPFWRLQLYGTGGFAAIPRYWTDAGAWLHAHQGHQNALLVPGADAAQYTWGDPVDEPLEAVGDTSLLWHDVIPLGSNGSTQTLSLIDRVLDGGTSPPGFSQFLSREGIKYVIERNDLNLAATGAPVPAQVHDVLSETPGLTEVASFGPLVSERQTGVRAPNVYDATADTHLRQVEIFRVRGSTSVIHTYPVADPIVVSGDAGSLLPLEGAGVLAGRATFLAGDPQAGRATNAADATWAITDGNQRRDVQYGGVRNNTSYLLGADQTSSSKAASVPLTYLVVPGASHQTVEAPIGAASVSASSYGSSTLYVQPVNGPYAAFDDDPNTAWVANATNGSVGQWVSITFNRPVSLSTISVTPLTGSPLQPIMTKVTITTEQGSVTRRLPDRSGPSQLDLPKGPSTYLKVSIAAVRRPQTPSGGLALGAGIVDIHIPGVSFRENMRVPDDESAAFASAGRNNPVIVFSRPLLNQNLLLGSGVSDDPEVARTLVVPHPMITDVSGYAAPVPGPALETLLEYYTPPRSLDEQVVASSWFNDLPRFRAENLLDDAGSPWIAGTGDSRPTVILGWSGPRSVDSIVLTPTHQASRPTEISVSGATGPAQIVPVPAAGGVVRFAPIVTDQLRIEVVHSAPRTALSPAYGVRTTLPVGIQSLRVPALGADEPTPPNASFPLVLQCGQGPPVTIDGRTYPTSVSGTLGDLLDLRPVRITACSDGIALSAGPHSLHAPPTFGAFDVTSLALDDPLNAVSAANGHTARSASVVKWTASTRTLRVGAGPATYVVLPQNYNDAWVATFGGRTLTPVRVDGWQQGYIVPSGGAGTVQLAVPSDSLFRLGLLLGASLLVFLLVLAVLPARREEPEAVGPRTVAGPWVLAALAVAALVLVGGILALVAVPLLWAARRWGQNVMAAVAFAAFVGAGCVVAWHAGALPNLQTGAFGRPAQVASAVAFGAVLCAAVSEHLPRQPRSDGSRDET